MTRNIIIVILLVGLAGLTISCQGNIFGWLYPEDEVSETGNFEDLIALGDAALRDGKPEKAMTYYKRAIDAKPTSSEARWGYARAFTLSKNADLLYLISRLYGNRSDANTVITELIITYDLENSMTTIIDTLDNPTYSIVDGKCDGVVPYNDFGVNFNLMISYFIRALIKIGDSNKDLLYFTESVAGEGDFLLFGAGDLLAPNTSVINQDESQESFASGFEYITNQVNQSNSVSTTYYINTLFLLHEIIEDITFMYKLTGYGFDDFFEFFVCFARGVEGLASGSDSETVDKMVRDARKNYDKFKNVRDAAPVDTLTLKGDHNQIVGRDLFAGGASYLDYDRNSSKWAIDWASPGAGSLVDRLKSFGPTLDPVIPLEALLIVDITTVSTQVMSHIANMKLIDAFNQ